MGLYLYREIICYLGEIQVCLGIPCLCLLALALMRGIGLCVPTLSVDLSWCHPIATLRDSSVFVLVSILLYGRSLAIKEC